MSGQPGLFRCLSLQKPLKRYILKNMAEETGKEKNVCQGHFIYADYASAELGKIEEEKIARLEKQMSYDDPQLVYSLYCKALEGKVFQSPVGFSYLVSLRDYLVAHKEMIQGDIPCIPADMIMVVDQAPIRKAEAARRRSDTERKRLGRRLLTAWMVIGVLLVMVIGMFIVTALSDSPTILNYEKEIQNRYAEWEQELNVRESVIRERERELKISE